MVKVLINGVTGKMGQEVLKKIQASSLFSIVCGVSKFANKAFEFPIYSNVNDILENPDVIIDFSTPEGTLSILDFAYKNLIPIVIATTGFSNEQLKIIENCSKKIPVFKAANMSFEINLMADMASKFAAQLNNCDIEIVDVHHNQKVDSPSGTALFLANSINSSLDNKMHYEFNRHSKKEKRTPTEIGIHSIRGGTEVGKHTIIFFTENESFELTHTITSRSVFADGALKASEFIISQANGLYSMKDLI